MNALELGRAIRQDAGSLSGLLDTLPGHREPTRGFRLPWTEFSSRVSYEKKGDLHYFTYAGDNSVTPNAVMHLRSEQATVVIDTMQERRF